MGKLAKIGLIAESCWEKKTPGGNVEKLARGVVSSAGVLSWQSDEMATVVRAQRREGQEATWDCHCPDPPALTRLPRLHQPDSIEIAERIVGGGLGLGTGTRSLS